jgi:hypothetical protein
MVKCGVLFDVRTEFLNGLSPRLATPALDTYINLDPFVLGSLIPDDGGSTRLWNVGRQSFYTAV